MRSATAALVVIGNEVLSGKVTDANSPLAARELRAAGVSLERILVIPDEVELIAAAVAEFARQFDFVITSGGVGPTHDDVTMAGVALGLGVAVVHHPRLVEALRSFGELTPARLKMAEVPDGAELLPASDRRFPVVRAGNVFVLPGIPQHFRDKLGVVAALMAADPFVLRTVYLQAQESSIAAPLRNTWSAFPDLQLGSYPVLDQPDYTVRVTLEAKLSNYVADALRHLLAQLPVAMVVRVD